MRGVPLLLLLLLWLLTACNDSEVVLPPPPQVADPILIDARWEPSTPTVGTTADILVTIQNQGGLPAGDFELRIEVVKDPCSAGAQVEQSFQETVRGLPAGGAVVVPASYRFTEAGDYGLYLTLDPGGLVDENIPGEWDGETNNRYRCSDIIDKDGRATLSSGETRIVVLNTAPN